MKHARGSLLPVFLGADDRGADDRGADAAPRGTPLYAQLYRRVRAAILDGALRPGHRLPSARTLAADLGVSRNTVEQAVAQLHAEGFLTRRVGAGTYVSDRLPGPTTAGPRQPALAARRLAGPLAGREREGDAAPSGRLSARGRLLAGALAGVDPAVRRGPSTADRAGARARQHTGGHGGTQLRTFAPCLASLDDFPLRVWTRLLARRTRGADTALLGRGDPAGYRPLREALAAHVRTARGVRCDWRQVAVVASTQQALDLLARLLLDPGDAVWVEDPGYCRARAAFAGAGARLVPVPVDAEGLDVAAGEALAPAARLAYVTPSHQFPLGVTLSLPRRLALLAWARRAGAWVVEDDYDSEFRHAGRPIAALQGLDADPHGGAEGGAGRVLYVGTLNKVLFPALRIAYVVVPEDLVEAVAPARAASDGAAPALTQAALADFVADGHLAAHLRRMRGVYRERRDALAAACREHLGDALRLGPSHTGLHVTGWLAGRLAALSDHEASRRAAAWGLDTPPLSMFYATFPIITRPAPDMLGRGGLVLHYGAAPSDAVRAGVRTLASALEAAEAA